MNNTQMLIQAIDLLDEAEVLIQDAFAGIGLYEVTEAINGVIEMIERLAEENNINLGK